jgi:hypothetical protein
LGPLSLTQSVRYSSFGSVSEATFSSPQSAKNMVLLIDTRTATPSGSPGKKNDASVAYTSRCSTNRIFPVHDADVNSVSFTSMSTWSRSELSYAEVRQQLVPVTTGRPNTRTYKSRIQPGGVFAA